MASTASRPTGRDGFAWWRWQTWARTHLSSTTSAGPTRASPTRCRALRSGPTSRPPSECSGRSNAPITAASSTLSSSRPRPAKVQATWLRYCGPELSGHTTETASGRQASLLERPEHHAGARLGLEEGALWWHAAPGLRDSLDLGDRHRPKQKRSIRAALPHLRDCPVPAGLVRELVVRETRQRGGEPARVQVVIGRLLERRK